MERTKVKGRRRERGEGGNATGKRKMAYIHIPAFFLFGLDMFGEFVYIMGLRFFGSFVLGLTIASENGCR